MWTYEGAGLGTECGALREENSAPELPCLRVLRVKQIKSSGESEME